jgi:HD-GYP domain-containing protein (c-di-GMP phosphodiesterase class II)/CHASE2 domain-containing sensor protein
MLLIGVVLIFAGDYAGLLEGIDNYLYDLSFRIRGPSKPSDNILLVAIDEKTLSHIGRWPIDRKYYASLLDKTGEAAVLGFDIVFAEPSEHDPVFSESLKRHGKAILPVYIDQQMNITRPYSSLASSPVGHVHIEEGVDNIVRAVFHSLYYQNEQLPSITSAMYETITHTRLTRQSMPQNSPGSRKQRIFQQDYMKINFFGTPRTFRYISMFDILQDKYPPSFFKGKALLVGITAPGIVDMVATPFSEKRNKMPGGEIHATILNNLMQGNAIQDILEGVRWLFVMCVSFLLLVFFLKASEKNATLIWVGSVVIILVLVFCIFSFLHLWIRPGLFVFSITFFYIFTYIVKLDEATRVLDTKHAEVSKLISGGPEKDLLQLTSPRGLRSYLSVGGVHHKINRLLLIEEEYEKNLQKTIQEKTEELSYAIETIKDMNSEVITRLTAAVESKESGTGKHISRISLYANRIASAMQMPGEFVEQITFASAMHDIGKIGIPNQILLKPASLSGEEFEVIKTHTTIGGKILSGSSFPIIQMSHRIALYHHERWCGFGYPHSLKGEDIPVEARIVTICDIYDALRSRRPYKDAFPHELAFSIIVQGDQRTMPEYFDPAVLHAFIQVALEFDAIFLNYHD